jgi:hypothetical protein
MIPTSDIPSLLVSREELVFLLSLLQADQIPGMDEDPLRNLSKDQQTLVLAQAERSLRAKGLADVDTQGRLTVREAVLMLVGTCAFPEFMVAVHRFPSDSPGQRVFYNGRNGVIVAHERPEAPLHRFSFINDRAGLFEQILALGAVAANERPDTPVFETNQEALQSARETLQLNRATSVATLVKSGMKAQTAEQLCSLLGKSHVVATIHAMYMTGANEARQEAITLISNETATWRSENLPGGKILLIPSGRDEIQQMLLAWSAPAENWVAVNP